MKNSEQGVTLIEIMMVVAIVGLIAAAFALFLSKGLPFFHRNQVRQGLMLDSRRVMDTIVERLRNGKARTLIIQTDSTVTPVVPNSRADFVLQTPLPSGATAYAIYQAGGKIYTLEYPPGNAAQAIASNVTGLIFSVPNSTDPGIVNVTLQMNVPYDQTGDPTHTSMILFPNQNIHMVETR